MPTMLDKMFEDASNIHCHEEGCFDTLCPVNNLVFLINNHIASNNPLIIVGDFLLLQELAGKKESI